MPKLPVIKASELISALEQAGFSIHRQSRGSHIMMTHSDGRMTIVPNHKGRDVPNGTLMAILRDIGLSKEDFVASL